MDTNTQNQAQPNQSQEQNQIITLYDYFISSPFFGNIKDWGIDNLKFLKDFVESPEPIKYLLVSEETAHKIAQIGIQFNLRDDQVSNLAGLVRELIMKQILIQDLPQQIAIRAKVDPSLANSVAKELILTVINPMVKDLKKNQTMSPIQTPPNLPNPLPTSPNTNINKNNVLDLRNKSSNQ